MSDANLSLPAGFKVLEPFAQTWAIPGLAARAVMRGSASAADRRTFYDAAAPMLDKALACLDTKPLEAFDAADNRLLWMMLSLAHVAIGEEIQREDEAYHATLRALMPITRAPIDW